MNLVKPSDPALRRKCIENFTVGRGLIDSMFEIMAAKGGCGLAAPQVGYPYRLFILDTGDVFINPTLVAKSIETDVMEEGCLSLPGLRVPVRRSVHVTVNGIRYYGIQARAIQHELDHLNGILISDYRPALNRADLGLHR